MIWRFLARAVAALHIGYAAFVVLGSLLVLVWPWMIWVHVAAVIWAGATLTFDLGCPMTPWEKQFWRRGGAEPYDEGFLQHYILSFVGNPENERRNHVIAGTAVVLLNIVVYVLVFTRK